MLSAEGLITLERVTLDGTKIKPMPGQHLPPQGEAGGSPAIGARASAVDEKQAAEEEQMSKRQVAARRRAARQPRAVLEAAVREVERLQREKKDDRGSFVARASTTDRKPT